MSEAAAQEVLDVSEESDGIRWRTKRLRELSEDEDTYDVARSTNTALEQALEKAAGVPLAVFDRAYGLVVNSGLFGPFQTEPDEVCGAMTLQDAEVIVKRAAAQAHMKDVEYNDPDDEDSQCCPSCGSLSLSSLNDDYSSYSCRECRRTFEEPFNVPNARLSGSSLLAEVFQDYYYIYGD